jgi:hypothetical protein
MSIANLHVLQDSAADPNSQFKQTRFANPALTMSAHRLRACIVRFAR